MINILSITGNIIIFLMFNVDMFNTEEGQLKSE